MSRRMPKRLLGSAPILAAALGLVGVFGFVLINQSAPVVQIGGDASLPVLGAPVQAQAAATAGPGPGITRPAGVTNLRSVKAMLASAASKHGVNAGLVMGLAWWESGWDQSQVSSTGAIGIMQVEPYTATDAGPRLLHRTVDIHEAASNVDLGTAILKDNLVRYRGNLINALVAYYAGPGAVTDWAHLQPDAQRYVLGIYSLAVAFDRGHGPA